MKIAESRRGASRRRQESCDTVSEEMKPIERSGTFTRLKWTLQEFRGRAFLGSEYDGVHLVFQEYYGVVVDAAGIERREFAIPAHPDIVALGDLVRRLRPPLLQSACDENGFLFLADFPDIYWDGESRLYRKVGTGRVVSGFQVQDSV